MSKSIRCNRKVRDLLVELDEAIQKFQSQTAILSNRHIDNSTAMNIGADREAIRSLIVGIAWRINKASKGMKE